MAEVAIHTGFDVQQIRADFPTLQQEVHGKPLVYFDNAATAQKPRAVIDRISRYYELENANIHRGVHYLSQRSTEAFEDTRTTVQRLLNAPAPEQVLFTRGTTEAINLVAQAWGRTNVGPGDEVVISWMEHHSNIVPWQMLCEEKGAVLLVIPVDDRGDLIMEEAERLIGERTRIVALSHISNTLGTINPVEEIIRLARSAGAVVLLDGAQAVPHMPVDVQALDVDFYCFSGHKLFGPTGIGVLYGRRALLDAMPPWQGGGDMIDQVSFEKTTYNVIPHKFEAGTPHIAGGIGLGAAVEYVNGIGYDAIAAQESALLEYGHARLSEIDGIRFIGTARKKASVISFLLEGVHPYDTGTILDQMGIAIRTGHHCTQPLMSRYGIPGTARASFAFYNTTEEIDRLAEGLRLVKKMFS
jgi:cysteine desulfurase / selenocysteine lyase